MADNQKTQEQAVQPDDFDQSVPKAFGGLNVAKTEPKPAPAEEPSKVTLPNPSTPGSGAAIHVVADSEPTQ